MKSLFNRLSLVATTGALVLAQVVMPVQAAFAAGNEGTLKVHEANEAIGTPSNSPHVCSFNFEAFGLNAGQTGDITITNQSPTTPAGATALTVSLTTDINGDGSTPNDNDTSHYINGTYGPSLANGHYKVTLDNKFGTDNNGKAKSKVIWVQCGTPTQPTSVTPDIAIVDKCGTTDDSVVGIATDGIDYAYSQAGLTYTVIAAPEAGYMLNVANQSGWVQNSNDGTATYTATLTDKPCESTEIIEVPNVEVNDECGPGNAVYGDVPEGNYTIVRNQDGSITLTAKANYTFKDGTVVTLPAPTDSNESCPYTPPVTPPCIEDITTGAAGKIKGSDGTIIFERYIDRWGDNTRVGAGTRVPLYNVTLTIKYDHLANTTAINSGVTPGWGAVEEALRQAYVPGIDTGTVYTGQQGPLTMHTADILSHATVSGNSLIVTIGYMPAGSSFSFNAGSGVIDAVLNGQRETACEAPVFPPTTCEMATGSVIATFDSEKYVYKVSGPGLDGQVRLKSGVATPLLLPGTYTVTAYMHIGEGLVEVQSWTHVNPVLDCTPGKGSEGPAPVTPTPEKLPQLLPHTGPSDTMGAQNLLLALVAAIATYGAVYIAQGKRRYE